MQIKISSWWKKIWRVFGSTKRFVFMKKEKANFKTKTLLFPRFPVQKIVPIPGCPAWVISYEFCSHLKENKFLAIKIWNATGGALNGLCWGMVLSCSWLMLNWLPKPKYEIKSETCFCNLHNSFKYHEYNLIHIQLELTLYISFYL